jgi:hypothetical protein
MEPIDLGDIELACVGSDDWYTIERAHHEGRMELRPTSYGMAFWSSARISDACVEGMGYEMLAIADAIDAGIDVEFRRCAVTFTPDGVLFESPRNSTRPARVSVTSAKALAAKIRAAVTAPEVA